MSDLGSLYFQLGLDDKKFNDAIEAAKQKVKELGADVEIGVKLNVESLKKEIQAAANAAGGGSFEIGANVKTDGLENMRSMLEASKKEAKELEEAITKATTASVRVQKQSELDSVRKRISEQEAKILAKGGSFDAPKPAIVKVQLDEESINQVKARLAQLESPITPKISVEYDVDKFHAATTTLDNYTKRLNELGKIRLGIDDSFLRTGVSSSNGKGLNGWLNKVSDYLLGDDTGEAAKSIKSIQKILDNHTFKVKVDVDAAQLAASVKTSVKRVPIDVDVNAEEVKKKLKQLKVPLDFNVQDAIKAVKAELKRQEFKAKLSFTVTKKEINEVIQNAVNQSKSTSTTTRKASKSSTKKATGEMKDLGNATKDASNWASQLSNQFNNLVSIYSLERFIRNLYTIGGEFQKQQIALQNMIGDVNKGNAIFERMKGLAVKSPFTFSELSSYTKQMSAYGIEYENLYDTTKRLADISAGVGVDMGRLILAFGQVRSAAVLRGQELRQFTEAGIPLVAELAKKFTELEGRVVSTGEVFEKISKREVSFGMVKDILFDMTDPGGRFFETQEKLAESLAGKWSNLKDAWDIMVADIANGANGILGAAADALTKVTREWENYSKAIMGVVVALGVYRATVTVINALGTIATMSFSWPAAIAAAMGVVGIAFADTALKANSLKGILDGISASAEANIQQSYETEENSKRYLKTLKETSDKESERALLLAKQKLAFAKLKEEYPDLLRYMELEKLTLDDINRLESQIEARETSKRTNSLESKYDEMFAEAERQKAIYESLERRLNKKKSGELGFWESLSYIGVTDEALQEQLNRYVTAQNAATKAYSEWVKALNEGKKTPDVEDRAAWKLRADAIIDKYPTAHIRKPNKDEDIYTYFDYLEGHFKDAKEKFDRTVDKELRKPQKSLMDAFNAVNMGIGGVSFYSSKKKGGKSEAEKAAERDAKAYLDALKERLKEIGSQWSLFKELMDATGNRQLSLNLSGLSGIDFRNQLEHLRSEMTKELQKTGVNLSAADVFNMSFDELAKIVGDEEKLKRIKEIYDTYHNASRDLRMETIKDFAEIIKASRDFESKIAEIERKLQEDLSKLRLGAKEGGLDLNSEEYKRAEAKLREEAEKAKANERFEEFKASSDWVKVFDDLDRVATPTLDDMLDKMEAFIYQIEESPEAMKEMLKALGDVREKLSERNPFGAFTRWLKEIRNIKAARWLLAGNDSYTFQQDLYGFKAGQKITPEILDNLENGAVSDFNLALAGTSAAFENLKSVIEPVIDLFNHGVDSVSIFLSAIGGALSGALNMGQSFEGLMGLSFGKDGEKLGSMLGIKNAGFWGAAAGAALGAISAISEAHDKKLDKTIRKSQLEVQKLGNEYKNLEHTIERQLGSQTASQSKVMIANLRSQRRELMEQYGLEDEKKKTDASKLEDYKQQISELDDQIKYFYEDLAKEQYGADIKDWAGQIASALVEAFASGENAAAAFDDTVGGILRNLATEAIRLQFIEPAMAGLRDFMFGNVGVFTDLSESGSDLSANEAIQLQGELDKLKGQIEKSNDYWDKINEAVGGIMDDTESAASGGLSKGIQSVTEDTANLLGSYLNSIRHDSSVQRTLVEQLVSVDVPKMSIIAQAQLQQLQQVAANTKRNADAADRIYELVNKVVDKGSNKLKV